jgi:hypothetical protein
MDGWMDGWMDVCVCVGPRVVCVSRSVVSCCCWSCSRIIITQQASLDLDSRSSQNPRFCSDSTQPRTNLIPPLSLPPQITSIEYGRVR